MKYRWIQSALCGDGKLTMASRLKGKSWLVARMTWPNMDAIQGAMSLSVDGALESLDAALMKDAEKEKDAGR